MKFHIRIKYCGGCNPDYDRSALVEEIKERLQGLVQWSCSDSGPCDLVLAVHGCQTACADLSTFDGYEIYHISCPEDADRFISHVRSSGFVQLG